MNGMPVKSMYIHISYLEIQIATKKILNNKCHLSHFLYIKRIREEIKHWKLLDISYQGNGWYSNFGKDSSRSIFISCYSNQSGLKFVSLRQSVPVLVPPHTINLSVYAFNFKCKNYSNIAFQQGMFHVSLDPGLTSVWKLCVWRYVMNSSLAFY